MRRHPEPPPAKGVEPARTWAAAAGPLAPVNGAPSAPPMAVSNQPAVTVSHPRPAPSRATAPAVRVAASAGIRRGASARLRRERPAPESMWARLRRGLFGESSSYWED